MAGRVLGSQWASAHSSLSLNVADARKRVRERLKLSIPKCEWRVHEVAAKGDCFFLCIALARESLGFEMVLDMKASAMRVRARLCDFAEQHPQQAARFIYACPNHLCAPH